MPLFDNPKENLQWMQEELLSDEFLEDEDQCQEPLEEEDEEVEMDPALYLEAPKKKSSGRLILLALVEIAAIYILIRWWTQWR